MATIAMASSLSRSPVRNPVAFAQLITTEGKEPSHIRFRKVSSNRVELKIEEWTNLDGYHDPEQIALVVLEAGTHRLTDDHTIEVGTVDASKRERSVFLDNKFSKTPVVISQCQTFHDPHPVVTRQWHPEELGPTGFKVRIQKEEKLRRTTHAVESIGYLALGKLKARPAEEVEVVETEPVEEVEVVETEPVEEVEVVETEPEEAVSESMDNTSPSRPYELVLENSSTSQLQISWKAATDNVGVTGYNLYRNDTFLTQTVNLRLEDDNLQSGTTYVYEVSAVDAAGNESRRARLEGKNSSRKPCACRPF